MLGPTKAKKQKKMHLKELTKTCTLSERSRGHSLHMNLRHVLCGGRIHDSGLSRCLSQIKAHYMCERTAVRVALFITDICCLTSFGLRATDVTTLLDMLDADWIV